MNKRYLLSRITYNSSPIIELANNYVVKTQFISS